MRRSNTYVDVVLGAIGMWHKGLDEESPEDTIDVLDLLGLAGALRYPGLRLWPGLVQGQQTALASALDELIRLRDKLGAGLEEPWVGDLGLVEDIKGVLILGEV